MVMTGCAGVVWGVVMMWGVPVVSVMMMLKGLPAAAATSVAIGYMKSMPWCSRWWLLVLCPVRSVLISMSSRSRRATAIASSIASLAWASWWYASEPAGRFVRGFCCRWVSWAAWYSSSASVVIRVLYRYRLAGF